MRKQKIPALYHFFDIAGGVKMEITLSVFRREALLCNLKCLTDREIIREEKLSEMPVFYIESGNLKNAFYRKG